VRRKGNNIIVNYSAFILIITGSRPFVLIRRNFKPTQIARLLPSNGNDIIQ
jgi:hypothetical protein